VVMVAVLLTAMSHHTHEKACRLFGFFLTDLNFESFDQFCGREFRDVSLCVTDGLQCQ
jgi:hypothetical protein